MADNGINMENHENSSEFRRLERPIQIGDELIGVSGDQYKRAIVSDAILVFEFNLTKNLLMGNPLQPFGERIVRLRHAFDLPEECSYDKFLDSVSWDLSDSEKEKFMANMYAT